MLRTIRLEELGLAALAWVMTVVGGWDWWWWPLLWLAPDLSMVGYLMGPRFGAILYNLVHHRGIAATVIAAGYLLHNPLLQLIGWVLFGHSSTDRALGYGLKFADSFQHTHLGWIGHSKKSQEN